MSKIDCCNVDFMTKVAKKYDLRHMLKNYCFLKNIF